VITDADKFIWYFGFLHKAMWGGGRGSGIFQRRAIFVLSRPNLANLGFSSLLPDSDTAMHILGFVPEAQALFKMICISESEIAPRFSHEVFSRLATPHRSARHNSHEAHDDCWLGGEVLKLR